MGLGVTQNMVKVVYGLPLTVPILIHRVTTVLLLGLPMIVMMKINMTQSATG